MRNSLEVEGGWFQVYVFDRKAGAFLASMVIHGREHDQQRAPGSMCGGPLWPMTSIPGTSGIPRWDNVTGRVWEGRPPTGGAPSVLIAWSRKWTNSCSVSGRIQAIRVHIEASLHAMNYTKPASRSFMITPYGETGMIEIATRVSAQGKYDQMDTERWDCKWNFQENFSRWSGLAEAPLRIIPTGRLVQKQASIKTNG